jgi:hypothetical protein
MRKILILPAAGLILLGSSLLWAINVTSLTATPGTITFNANTPGSNIAGNPPSAIVTFSITSSSHSNWTLSAGSTASTFTSCPTVPASAVQVECTAASVSPGGAGANASCAVTGFTALPSTLPGLQVASGKEPMDGSTKNYTITLAYQLADSWKYVANAMCPLTVTYTANAQ